MATFVILGAGMMGSAIALPFFDQGHEVRLVGTHLDREIIDSLRRSGVHPKMGLELPRGITHHHHDELPSALEGCDALVLGVSSAGVRWAAERVAPLLEAEGPPLPVLMVTKGLALEGGVLRALPDVLRGLMPPELRGQIAPAAVAGPCIAGELARRVETCVVFAGREPASLARLAAWARGPYYHVWTSADVEGVEACAALKNAYAMAIGFGPGLHERRGGQAGSVAMHNHESAVFAQASIEMRRLVVLLGGNADVASGLPGVGDLDVTTNGGRTGRFGRLLGLGLPLAEAIARMEGATLECLDILAQLAAALPAYEQAGKLGPDELPLLRHMIEVTRDGKPVAVPFGRFFGGEGR
jgi:glycerol-3-phosphate dehydrogenase (NAD(P)+)